MTDTNARCAANLDPTAPAPSESPRRAAVGDIVGAFKSLTTNAYIHKVKTAGWPPFRGRLWQRNYYEHIIRNRTALDHIRHYVARNPEQWTTDREHPAFRTS